MTPIARTLASLLVAAAAAGLTGCDGGSPAASIAAAQQALAKGDANAAIIRAKTALQDAPKSAEARFVLGQALLASGDAAAAEIELRKAQELGLAAARVVPELARALVARGELQGLIDQFGQTALPDPAALADLKLTLARAHAALRQREPARSAAQSALQAVPGHGPTLVFLARLQAADGDLDGALAALDAQLARTPQDAEAWQLKGDLLAAGQGDADGALAAYRESIRLEPRRLPAHAAAMTVLLERGDLPGAQPQFAGMQKALPGQPQTRYFEGMLALLAGSLPKAAEVAEQLLRQSPSNPLVLELAGAVEFARRAWPLAEAHLARAVQLAPGREPARRLLALTYLERAQPDKALAALQPLVERPRPMAGDLKLKAQAHLLAGQFAEAAAAIAMASKIDPGDARSRTALAISKVLGGDASAGLADLQSLAAARDDAVADLPLIATLVRKKDYAGALRAVDALEKKQPGQPLAHDLRGRVLAAKGDWAGAAKAFERALQLQPAYFPAAAALAQLALDARRPDEAQARLDAVVKADPTNAQALLASARLKARRGAPRDEVAAVFADAIRRAPTEPALRLALVDFHLRRNDPPAALNAAQQAVAALPEQPALLDALARAEAAAGDTNQAVATLNKLARLAPASPAPWLRLGEVQLAARNAPAASQALRRALELEPGYLPAQRLLVDAYVIERKPDEALAVAREVQKQRPTEAAGFQLEGGVHASQKRWAPALAAFRAGLKAAPDSTDLAIRVVQALGADQQPAEAERFAKAWMQSHPGDAAFLLRLGDLAAARQDLAAAEARYREVLRLQPDHAVALNNVAWLMATGKRPGAVAMAEKAVALMPDSPAALDTLALALATEGQPAKAAEVMRRALVFDERNAPRRLRLARYLIAAGDKSAAKTELKALAALGERFAQQPQVAEMLKAL